MRSICDLEYKDNLFIDLHLPDTNEFDLFIYFHGGGLTAGKRGGVEVFADTLAKRNIATATVEYRLYPKAKFPDFINDGADAVKWLFDNISRFGKCGRVFVGGSSAGAYISMMLCFDSRYLASVGMKPTDISGYLHDAGQPTAHYNVLGERGLDKRRLIVDETAPMYFVGLEEKYSPMMFVVSDGDMFGRYEQTKLMINVLNHFGHKDNVFLEVKHGKHCEYVYKKDADGEGVLGKLLLLLADKIEA